VIGVVSHPELPPDDRRHPLGGPDIPAKAERLGPLGQQHRHPRPLLSGQLRGRPRQGTALQPVDADLTPASHPLAHRPGRHPEPFRNRLLTPPLLFELPRPKPSPFTPLLRLRYFLCHTSDPCRAQTSLAPRAEISKTGFLLQCYSNPGGKR
jgi:hypothetical protein